MARCTSFPSVCRLAPVVPCCSAGIRLEVAEPVLSLSSLQWVPSEPVRCIITAVAHPIPTPVFTALSDCPSTDSPTVPKVGSWTLLPVWGVGFSHFTPPLLFDLEPIETCCRWKVDGVGSGLDWIIHKQRERLGFTQVRHWTILLPYILALMVLVACWSEAESKLWTDFVASVSGRVSSRQWF